MISLLHLRVQFGHFIVNIHLLKYASNETCYEDHNYTDKYCVYTDYILSI